MIPEFPEFTEFPESHNFENHQYKRTDGLSGQDRWLLAVETI